MESLRGSEGSGAKAYFGVFDELILQNKADFFFRERSRRPPLDRVNALLSFAYSLLGNDCAAALESGWAGCLCRLSASGSSGAHLTGAGS